MSQCSPGSMRGFMQKKEGLGGEERQDSGRELLQSLSQLLAPLHQPLAAPRPGYRLIGPHLLVLRPAHHHHGLHIHPLQERQPKGKSLNQFPALKHRAVHLKETETQIGRRLASFQTK